MNYEFLTTNDQPFVIDYDYRAWYKAWYKLTTQAAAQNAVPKALSTW